jgi:glucose dehydrogenase
MADIEDLRAAFEQIKAFKLARLYPSFCFSAPRSAPHVTKARGRVMKMVLLTVTLLAVRPLAAHGQSTQDLKSDHQTPDNIYTHGMGYGLQRFSSLQQINRDTVKRLVPAWTYSLADNRGQETQPSRAYSAEGRRPSTGPEKRSAQRAGQRLRGEQSPAAGGR